jgi:CDP-diacylglycerol---serine O-phosphatidyltransferase
LVTVPFLGLGIVALVYLATIPYTLYRHAWLAQHPEAWNVPVRERRALRSARSARRLGLRSPLRRRVAGRASAMARAVRRLGDDGVGRTNGQGGGGPGPAQPRNRLRLGLRRARRR